ncbi:hypothetical protein FQN49_000305 [Arthroderma sp. PD_2]|nr:hypothetical protein FQN49_000305 [Arthroderma sp. PD_2]
MAVSRSSYSSYPRSEYNCFSDYASPPTRVAHRLSLGDIIEVCVEPICVGFAPSKGRRCHNPIAQPNRAFASRLLDQGTSKLHNGESVSWILKELASRLLCRGNHQDQACSIAQRWERLVAESAYGQAVHAPATTPRRVTYTLPPRQLRQSVRQRPIEQESNLFVPSRSPSVTSSNVPRNYTPRRIALPPATRTRQVPVPAPSAVRKRIRRTEDCPICQERLLPSLSSNGQSITWCKALCGSNFHADCINEWGRSGPRSRFNCPCCRATWFNHDDFSDPELEEEVGEEEETEPTTNHTEALESPRHAPPNEIEEALATTEVTEEQVINEPTEDEEEATAVQEEQVEEPVADVIEEWAEEAVEVEQSQGREDGAQQEEEETPRSERASAEETIEQISVDRETYPAVPNTPIERVMPNITTLNGRETQLARSRQLAPNRSLQSQREDSDPGCYLDAILLILYMVFGL